MLLLLHGAEENTQFTESSAGGTQQSSALLLSILPCEAEHKTQHPPSACQSAQSKVSTFSPSHKATGTLALVHASPLRKFQAQALQVLDGPAVLLCQVFSTCPSLTVSSQSPPTTGSSRNPWLSSHSLPHFQPGTLTITASHHFYLKFSHVPFLQKTHRGILAQRERSNTL